MHTQLPESRHIPVGAWTPAPVPKGSSKALWNEEATALFWPRREGGDIEGPLFKLLLP